MRGQRGYTTLVGAIFILIMGSILLYGVNIKGSPSSSSAPAASISSSTSQYCIDVSPSEAFTFQAKSDNVTKGSGSDHNFGALTTYRQIKQNVLIDEAQFFNNPKHSSLEETRPIGGENYKIYYPNISGEIRLADPVQSRTRNENTRLLYFIDYGLIFAVKEGATSVAGVDNTGAQNTFMVADIYKDINRPELPQAAFNCSANSSTSGVSVANSSQSASTNMNQVQLEWFNFGASSTTKGWAVECKPAVYLYPLKKQLVNVRVFPRGYFTYTDPIYDPEKGWIVTAYPDGKIQTENKTYPYLYYETKIENKYIQKPEKGWVLEYSKLNNLYRDILPRLGLNQTETKDFISYWEKSLPYSPYYYIGLMNSENIDLIEPLEILPKPDFVNRVRIYFEALDEPRAIEAPVIEDVSIPDGFRVTDWGGLIKNSRDSSFTCSQ